MRIGLGRGLWVALWVAAPGYLAGCGSVSGIHECSDGIDNDGDSLIDGDDPGCPFHGDSESPDPVACNDGIDNDRDGLIDRDDPGCLTDQGDSELHVPAPACNDGIDNDGDGLADHPEDPGCFLPLEDSEDDDCPGGDRCPMCSDGVDNDGDGLIDYPEDPGCGHAAGLDEFDVDPGACGGDLSVEMFPELGQAVGTIRPDTPSVMRSPRCGGDGPEIAWVVQVREPARLRLSTAHPTTTADTVVYLRRACPDPETELACNDDANEYAVSSELMVDVREPGPYYLVVDSANVGSTGGFRVKLEEFTLTGEPCDVDAPTCAPGQTCRTIHGTGDTLCLPPPCMDGHDNDGDGVADYPDEPGCAGREDVTEDDDCPDGPACPACSNAVDDDDDGAVDYPEDSIGCTAASDDDEADECAAGVPVRPFPAGGSISDTTPGSTSGYNDFGGSCDASTYPTEHIYALPIDRDLESITFSTERSPEDTVLYIRRGACEQESSEVACADPGPGGESITLDQPPQGLYYVFVDGDLSPNVDYVLDIHGVLGPGDACDPQDAMFACSDGYTCDVASHTCRVAACNNGVDDDGDGVSDYPEDPGCAGAGDDDEGDECPDGASCPACSNGVDDDSDGAIDYGADAGCDAAGDGDEIDACIPGVYPARLPAEGIAATTPPSSRGSRFTPGCHSSMQSTEDVYYFPLLRTLDSLTFSTEASTGDTVLSVRHADCGDTAAELACVQENNGGERITLDDPQPGTYYVFVDGDYASGIDYELAVWGTIAEGESCDPDDLQFTCMTGDHCDADARICRVAACSNGMDDDGDGVSDYPDDPGCDSGDDDDESDDCPGGAGCAACSNGTDDDGDSYADYPSDLGCDAASDDEESECTRESDAVDLVTATPMTGDTTGLSSDSSPSCRSGSSGPDKVYLLRVPGLLDELTVDTEGSSFDTVLSIKPESCAAGDWQCDDDSGSGTSSRIELADVAAGQYLIVIDGYSGSSGAYALNVSGTIAAGEPCDPAQVAAGILTCAPGTACTDAAGGPVCQ